ncbi:hypothetical protein [Phormidium nigroviride]
MTTVTICTTIQAEYYIAIRKYLLLAEVEATAITPKKDYPIDCCREQSPIAIGSLHKKQEWVVAIAMLGDIFIQMRGKLQPSE